LQPEGGTGVEVEPGFRGAHATTKLHVRVIHRPYYYIANTGARGWFVVVGCVISRTR
jgi:hypothetical protein